MCRADVAAESESTGATVLLSLASFLSCGAQMEDEAGHICHGHQAGQGAKSADLGLIAREFRVRWVLKDCVLNTFIIALQVQ